MHSLKLLLGTHPRGCWDASLRPGLDPWGARIGSFSSTTKKRFRNISLLKYPTDRIPKASHCTSSFSFLDFGVVGLSEGERLLYYRNLTVTMLGQAKPVMYPTPQHLSTVASILFLFLLPFRLSKLLTATIKVVPERRGIAKLVRHSQAKHWVAR